MSLASARTMAFSTLILAELLRSYSSRSINFTLFHIGVFSNPSLVKATAFSFFLMVIVMYVPFLEELFHLVDIGLYDWIIVLIAAFIPLVLGEVQKLFALERSKKSLKMWIKKIRSSIKRASFSFAMMWYNRKS